MLQELEIDGKQIWIDIDDDKLIKCPQCGSTEVVAIKQDGQHCNKLGLSFGRAVRNYIETVDCQGCGKLFTPFEIPKSQNCLEARRQG